MKVNLNFNLKNLDGADLENANAGKLVANALAGSQKGDALKFWDWALKLNKGEELDLDPSDATVFENFVKESEMFNILGKAQILTALKESKK